MEAPVQGIGRERGEVLAVQRDQRHGELAAVGVRGGVGIGLELVAAREQGAER
jgi:hypothetical protein